jgi:antitoxin (DNA-binding transcriptional repressor) of toxin-antitoxin stability system
MIASVDSVNATLLKNRLGEVIRRAALGPVAIVRHGRVVAHLVPPPGLKGRIASGAARPRRWTRREEERVVELCARRDFRPSRWLRAGEPRLLAGVAAMLASHPSFDRTRMLALAERLDPGMSTPGKLGRWLAGSPVLAARLMPMLEARLQERRAARPTGASRK